MQCLNHGYAKVKLIVIIIGPDMYDLCAYCTGVIVIGNGDGDEGEMTRWQKQN